MKKQESSQLTKKIEVGKFYLIHDGSRTGHPGYVIWKNDEKNRYLVILTDSDKRGQPSKKSRGEKHITMLKHPTDSNVVNSYVHNRPMICRRKDIGNKILVGMRFHLDDIELVNEISQRNPEKSPSLNKK